MANDFWDAVRPAGEVPRTGASRVRAGGGAPRHARRRLRSALARGAAIGVVGVLAFGSVAAATMYRSAVSQIEVQDVDDLVTERVRPKDPSDPFKDEPVDLLLMGTDIRDGSNADIGGAVVGMRSDTTMLVHVSADRRWVEIVSLPRDTFVDIPSCRLPDGSDSQPYRDKFNASFSVGSGGTDLRHAAACTINTVNAVTGVTVTNHAVVKMNGVIDVVDAIGGVRMCLPEAIHGDPASARIDLPAGESTLDGRTAIQFLRVRKGTGMGLELRSDLTRIERQQAFINATLRQILSADTLANPSRTYRLINAALGSLAADPAISDPTKVAGLVWSLRGIEQRNIIMTTVPVFDTTEGTQSGLGWSPDADEIFARIASDTPPDSVVLPDVKQSGSPSVSGAAQDGSAGTDPEDTAVTGDASADETGSPDSGSRNLPSSSPSPETLLDGVCA